MYSTYEHAVYNVFQKGSDSEEPVLTSAFSCDREHQLLQHQRQSCCSGPHTHHLCFRAGHTSKEAVSL